MYTSQCSRAIGCGILSSLALALIINLAFSYKSQRRCSIDDDEFPSFKKPEAEVAESAESEAEVIVKPQFDLGRRMPCKWSTGAGPRIGCVRDYPTELQVKALEQVNLSPRVIPSPMGSKIPIPSPRPSPGLRVSPRLAYMGIPTPKIRLTLPKPKRVIPLDPLLI